ncbi:endonuclease [Neptunitalea chrysea]|uniref:Endonuclease n=1 Tax=Neptunitalea chrysea TaxID=1647581 RepID=A0A9W6EW24_9FLAO|nr:endonuclease/exonuclease/phosphatase family protein [Neptunitalea chrysea]GLB52313.1 endonuclease [Neptunitalea chrysea]
MKKLSLFDKFLFIINSLLATVTLLAYFLPYLPPKGFRLISVLSLGLPVFLITNFLFVLYWLFRFKKQLFLSLITLFLGFTYVKSTVEFGHTPEPEGKNDFSLLTYNVRGFNYNEWSKDTTLKDSIQVFVVKESPDILLFQEFHKYEFSKYNKMYPYKAVFYRSFSYGQTIFSKYEIVDSGAFNFDGTGNNIIYADMLIEGKNVRVYNIHLESNNVTVDVERGLADADKEKMASTISRSFVRQQTQIDALIAQLQSYKGRYILAGDFNNTAYSYIYNELRRSADLQDSFEEAGSGFGKTYEFKYYPLRIDFVLADAGFHIKSHRNYNNYYSDHFPVKVVFGKDWLLDN